MGGFLGDLLLGTPDKLKTAYKPTDLDKWMGAIYNSPYASSYMSQLMRGTMGQMGSYGPGLQGGMLTAIAQALAGQYGNFLNSGAGLLQGSQYVQKGSAGLLPSIASGMGQPLGNALGASFLGGSSSAGLTGATTGADIGAILGLL